MLVKQIGTVVLTNPIKWVNYDVSNKVATEVEPNIDGGVIVYEQTIQDNAIYIELRSTNTSGWQSTAVKDALLTLANASLGLTTSIITSTDDTVNVRYAHEKTAVSFESVTEGDGGGYFTCNINLAKV